MEIITSAQNPQVKDLVRLQSSRGERARQRLFLAEGVKLAAEAVECGLTLEKLYFTKKAREKYPQELGRLLEAAGEGVEITQELAVKISCSPSPQGVFALCRMLDNRVDLAKIKRDGRYLLANSLQDPGNLGTIVRSCCAFGVDGLFLSADCPDLYSPKVLRGAMGGAFRLPIFVTQDMEKLVGELQSLGLMVYAAALSEGAQPIHQLSLGHGCGILIGNEGSGLPQELVQACSGQVIIPMSPGTDSLNAGVAAGILLWELYKNP